MVAFEGISRLYEEKPSVQASLKYLEKIGVQVNKSAATGLIEGYKNQPMKVNRVRPQFNSQGQLLIVKSNKVEIKEVPIVQGSTNEEQRNTYKGITQVLLKHTEIIPFTRDLNS